MRVIQTASVAAALALALGAPSASATFHNISIREVFPGSAAEPGVEYVELQMWASGQNLVKGHSLKAYGPGGGVTGTTIFTEDVSDAASQSTILLATPSAESHFNVVGDASMAATNQLNPAGGAVCWADVDCVSWGSFSTALPSFAGTPAPAIPDGMAVRRSISPGCPTFLEASDDHTTALPTSPRSLRLPDPTRPLPPRSAVPLPEVRPAAPVGRGATVRRRRP